MLSFVGRRDVHAVATEWADKYGGIYRISFPEPSYIISDAALVAPLLGRGENALPKSAKMYEPTLDLTCGHTTVFNEAPESPYWRAVRKAMAPCFSTEAMRRNFPVVLAHAQKVADMWAASHPGLEGGTVIAENWMQRVMLDIIGATGFGVTFNALDDPHAAFPAMMHDAMEEVHARLAVPWRRTIHHALPFLPAARKAARAFSEANKVYDGLIETLKSRGRPADSDLSMGAGLLRVKDPATDGPLPHAQLRANTALFVIAGYDTSAFTLTWALHDIARHPEVQRGIARELQAAGLLHVEGSPAPRSISFNDLTELRYFNTALKESMRLHPAAATGTGREVMGRDITVGDITIPRGSYVWIPLHALHTSHSNFQDPKVYDPSRWEGVEGGTVAEEGANGPADATATDKAAAATAVNGAASAHMTSNGSAPTGAGTYAPGARATRAGNVVELKKSFLPFSDGTRNCIGMAQGLMSTRTILMTLLSRFWLEVHPDVGSTQDVEREQVMALVLANGRPMKLTFRPHTSTY